MKGGQGQGKGGKGGGGNVLLHPPSSFHTHHRYILLAVAFVMELFLGGLAFGWSALSLMLKDEGIYSSECTPEELASEEGTCDAQELRLAVVWTVSAVFMNCGPAFTGILLDKFGPQIMASAGAAAVAVGLAVYSISSDHFDGFPLGAAFVSLGGITFHLSCFNIGNLFPTRRGLVTSMFVGGFTLSGQVYLVLYTIYGALGSSKGAYKGVMAGHSVLLAVCSAIIFCTFPRRSIKPGQTLVSRKSRLLVVELDAGGGAGGGAAGGGGACGPPPAPGPLSALKKMTGFREQLLQPLTLGFMAFFALSVLSFQLYVGTARLQLEAKGDSDDTGYFYTKAVNVFISCGLVALPLNFWALDKKGYTVTLGLILTFGVLSACMQIVPTLELQILTFIFWTLGRFMLYSCWFSMFLVLFGVQNFGKLIAVVSFATAALGLLQLPLTSVGLKQLGGDRWWVLNIAQVAWLLPLYSFVWRMRRWEREEGAAAEAMRQWQAAMLRAGDGGGDGGGGGGGEGGGEGGGGGGGEGGSRI